MQFVSIVSHMGKTAAKEYMTPDPEIMRRACDDLRSRCDFVVIDSPPGYSGGLVTAAIAAADEVIVVVMPRWHTVHAAKRLIEPVKSRDKQTMRLVINRMRLGKNRRRDEKPGVNEILKILQLDLSGVVPEDDSVLVSSNRGELAALDPRSPASKEYHNVARRLLGEEVPFVSLQD